MKVLEKPPGGWFTYEEIEQVRLIKIKCCLYIFVISGLHLKINKLFFVVFFFFMIHLGLLGFTCHFVVVMIKACVIL